MTVKDLMDKLEGLYTQNIQQLDGVATATASDCDYRVTIKILAKFATDGRADERDNDHGLLLYKLTLWLKIFTFIFCLESNGFIGDQHTINGWGSQLQHC
jgi:hypothetical protein